MKEHEEAYPHTSHPERAQAHEPHQYRVDKYGTSRHFAAYEGHSLIAVTVYRKGAAEITTRLEEKDRTIAALTSQLAALAESQVSPAPSEPVSAPAWTAPRQLDLIAEGDLAECRITSPRRRSARPPRRP
jgi:hypothetical protein